MRGLRVVNDRDKVVEVGTDGGGGDLWDFIHGVSCVRGRARPLGAPVWRATITGVRGGPSGPALPFLPRGDEHAVGVEFVRLEEELRVER